MRGVFGSLKNDSPALGNRTRQIRNLPATMLDVVLEGTVIETYIIGERLILEDEDGNEERWIPVTCPRKDCRQEFMVKSTWRELRTYGKSDGSGQMKVFITKSCPYCFRVSRLPERWWPTHVRDKYNRSSDRAREYYKTMVTPSQMKKGNV